MPNAFKMCCVQVDTPLRKTKIINFFEKWIFSREVLLIWKLTSNSALRNSLLCFHLSINCRYGERAIKLQRQGVKYDSASKKLRRCAVRCRSRLVLVLCK